jgi:DNA-binding NtrC family response regulator
MGNMDLKEEVRMFKYSAYWRALSENRGIVTKAANEVGVHRNTLNRMLREMGLSSYQLKLELGLKTQCVVEDRRRSAKKVAA